MRNQVEESSTRGICCSVTYLSRKVFYHLLISGQSVFTANALEKRVVLLPFDLRSPHPWNKLLHVSSARLVVYLHRCLQIHFSMMSVFFHLGMLIQHHQRLYIVSFPRPRVTFSPFSLSDVRKPKMLPHVGIINRCNSHKFSSLSSRCIYTTNMSVAIIFLSVGELSDRRYLFFFLSFFFTFSTLSLFFF